MAGGLAVVAVLATFALGSGVICSPETTRRFRLVPGGSQVIKLKVAGLPLASDKIDTSSGETIFLSKTR